MMQVMQLVVPAARLSSFTEVDSTVLHSQDADSHAKWASGMASCMRMPALIP